jgi:hypothetical protein
MGLRTWRLALGLAGVVLGLAACGGGGGSDSGGTAQVRVVNAARSYGALDFYVGGTLDASAVASQATSDYVSIEAGTYTTDFNRAGGATALNEQSRSFSADTAYTVVAFEQSGALSTFHLVENEVAPDAGKAKLRVVNVAPDAGAVDVYVTGNTDSLDDFSPAVAGVAGSSLSGYTSITQGTWRVRITGAGDKTDLRLDISGVSLANGDIGSLLVMPSSGGVLVNGLLLKQQGSATTYVNTAARARLVAGAAANGSVAATLGGVTLSSGARSPLVGAYTLVPAGTLSLNVSVNGTAASTGNVVAAPGADLTLLVYGPAASATVTTLVDDNRPAASGKAKVRLVNVVNDLGSGLSLVADFTSLADNVLLGGASAYATPAAGTVSQIEVDSPLSASALYATTDVTLQSGGVYTLFMLGSASSAGGVLRRDR